MKKKGSATPPPAGAAHFIFVLTVESHVRTSPLVLPAVTTAGVFAPVEAIT
jgi:hypothetical protein